MADVHDLRTTLGAAPLRRDLVHVAGPEAGEYLQGQLSQDIAALAVGDSAPSLLLQPTGKVDAWVRITRLGHEELALDVDAGHGERVLARLQRFKLRTKVDLELGVWSGLAVRGPGAAEVEVPAGALGLRPAWPGVPGLDILGPGELALAGVPLVPAAALEALRVECGVPALGAELTEDTIPAEAGQWLIDASVSFTKGCYTGQELVARVDSRGGNVPRPVRGLVVDGGVDGDPVPVGARVVHGGADMGAVTSSARSAALGSIALAVVARRVEPGERVSLEWSDGGAAATLTELPLR